MIEIAGYELEEPLPYIHVSIWGIIVFFIALIIGIIVVKIVASMIKSTLTKAKVGAILTEFTTRLISVILYIFVIVFALGYLGFNVGPYMTSLAVVMGFVLGFALADTLGSLAAGFMIAITKPFKAGDYVIVSGMDGVIKSVGVSVTELDTGDNKHVIIPNKNVWSNNIVNFTRNETRRVDMEVGVGYDTDLDNAMKLTMKVISSHPKVLKDPAPLVAVKEMADSAVILVVRPWCKTADYWDVFFDIKKGLKQRFDRENIIIPFPQMDVHLIEKK